ncbi:MAG TPA: hypothetical protein VL443_24205 [Cyclobacteriaceae bacterium]|jgi:hypothetical protein|nr:hypothetical protein [Cyclobacteriaceae bacterium]
MELIEGMGNETMPSVIKDPFNKNKIEMVAIYLMKSMFDDKYNASGKIKFKNGNTVGEQEFTGKSIDDIIIQMKAVLKDL